MSCIATKIIITRLKPQLAILLRSRGERVCLTVASSVFIYFAAEFYILGIITNQARFQRWSEKLNIHFDRLGSAIWALRDRVGAEFAVDLGTTNTRMYMRGRGVFVDEPSMIAMNLRDGRPVAVGSDARDMIGRSSNGVALHKPLGNGVIADTEYAALMLRYFLGKARQNNFPRWYKMAVSSPCSSTKLERRAIIEAATQSGAGKVFLAPTLIAAAIGVGFKIDSPKSRMLALLGGGVCEVGIIGIGHVIYSGATRVGGEIIDSTIYEYLLRRYNIQITMEMADNIKRTLLYAESSSTLGETMRVTGRGVGKGGLKTVEIGSTEISKAAEPHINLIVDLIQEAIDNSSPAVLSDLEKVPIVLTGGLSMLHGLPELIEKMTG
ncbi:MAG: rod shape-determining protein, partial [Desulfomonilaceae bacterium]